MSAYSFVVHFPSGLGIKTPMADESDPPRKFYNLKPKEFERVNDVIPAPVDRAIPDAANTTPPIPLPPPGTIDVHTLARQAQAPGNAPLLRSNRDATGPANDVHGMLRENLARANAAGANEMGPAPKRKNRRTRDYFIVLIPVNAFFAYFAFGPMANPVTFVYGVAGMAFFTVALTWVMFGIMNKY